MRLKIKNRSQKYDINRPTIIYKIFETNSSFYVKSSTKGKDHFLFFRRLFASADKVFIPGGWGGDCALGNNSMKF